MPALLGRRTVSEEEARAIFFSIDEDGSNSIDREELLVALDGLGFPLSQEPVERPFEEFDIDQDGLIDFDEFKNLLSCRA